MTASLIASWLAESLPLFTGIWMRYTLITTLWSWVLDSFIYLRLFEPQKLHFFSSLLWIVRFFVFLRIIVSDGVRHSLNFNLWVKILFIMELFATHDVLRALVVTAFSVLRATVFAVSHIAPWWAVDTWLILTILEASHKHLHVRVLTWLHLAASILII